MKHLTTILDKVANELEARGMKKLAAEVDVVANTLDKSAGDLRTQLIRQTSGGYYPYYPARPITDNELLTRLYFTDKEKLQGYLEPYRNIKGLRSLMADISRSLISQLERVTDGDSLINLLNRIILKSPKQSLLVGFLIKTLEMNKDFANRMAKHAVHSSKHLDIYIGTQGKPITPFDGLEDEHVVFPPLPTVLPGTKQEENIRWS